MRSMTLEDFENFLKQTRKQENQDWSIKRREYLHYLMNKLQNTLLTILSPESLLTDTTVSFWSKPSLTSRIFLTWAASTWILWLKKKKKETVPFLFLYAKSTCASWGITITIIIIIVVILKRDHQSHSFEKALNLKTSPWTRSVVYLTASHWFKITELKSSGNHPRT